MDSTYSFAVYKLAGQILGSIIEGQHDNVFQ